MEGKHMILLTLCCLWLYVAQARVISSVKSTKVRTVKVPACGCKSPVIEIPPCGCRGLGYDPYDCKCDLNMRRTCGCSNPVYLDPLDIPLCTCGSGLPVATVFAIEMPCGCQSLDTCTCGYKNSPLIPGIYDIVEVPRCGCQGAVKPCGCQPINACGCQSVKSCGCQPINACGCQSMKSCGCSTLNPCGCEGVVWMNNDYIAPYEVPSCRCTVPVTELACGCQDVNCGCRAMSNPYDIFGSILDACGCLIPAISEVPIYTCGCQSTPCGCGGCGCGCSGVTLPPVPPVAGCPKYLRQVKLQPPFL